MKKTPSLFLAILCSITFISTSCSKGGDGGSTQVPKEILTSHSWVFSQYKENGVAMTLKAPCEMDDYLTFSTTGSYIRNAGTVKCNAGDPQTFTDSWSLSSDNKTLTILSEVTGELTAISDASFTVRKTGANVFEYTYVKK